MRMPTCSILVLLLICTTSYGQTRGAGKVVTRLPSGDQLDLYDNSWAVVIGINNYDKWPDLQYAVNDARAIRDRMMTLGFPEVNISYIIDEEATKTNIERLLGDTMRRKVGENDRVFIYFAGHGQTEDLPGEKQEGYIVPVDGDKSELFSTCISMTTVRQFSDRMAAKHVFYAIDACYSGLALMRAGEMDPRDRQYMQKVARFPSRQLVTAGSAGEQVVEQGGHGAFTRTLLIALEGSADKYPPFGVLTGSELGNYLKPTVSVETNNAQTPQFGRLSAGEGEFMFVLPDLVDAGTSSAEQIQSEADQYGSQVENLKAQLEAEKKKLASEEAARADLERQKNEAEELQKQLDELKRQRKPAPSVPKARPSLPSGGTEVGEMVHVSDFGFYIDKYEVTNEQYAAFLNEKGNRSEDGASWLEDDSKHVLIEKEGGQFTPKSGYGDHPVIEVSWYGAKSYCEWAGKRLPTEEEWQQACQGMDGREYSWGNSFGSDISNISGSDDGYDETSPVGTFPGGASPYGAMDMSGNVWEWTSSLYESSKNWRVLRGGSWNDFADFARCESRNGDDPASRFYDYGFRCAR